MEGVEIMFSIILRIISSLLLLFFVIMIYIQLVSGIVRDYLYHLRVWLLMTYVVFVILATSILVSGKLFW